MSNWTGSLDDPVFDYLNIPLVKVRRVDHLTGVEYCEEHVGVVVCLSVSKYMCISSTTVQFSAIFAHDTHGRGTVLRWRRCDKLLIPGLCMTSFLDIIVRNC